MEDVVSLLSLAAYIIAILALSIAITWLVVKISPSESTREARRQAAGE